MKKIGLVLIIVSIIMILITTSFTFEFIARGEELHKTCSLPDNVCPFIEYPWQSIFLIIIELAIGGYGAYLFSTKNNPTSSQKTDLINAKKQLTKLIGDEKIVYELLIEENGLLFQSKIVEKTNYSKVKISRILDSLESQDLIERKRRGMTNLVILK